MQNGGYQSVTVRLLRVGDVVQTAAGRDVKVTDGPPGRHSACLTRERRTGRRMLRLLEFGDLVELTEEHSVLRRVKQRKDDPSLPPPPPTPRFD